MPYDIIRSLVGLEFVPLKASYQIDSHMNTKDIFLAYHLMSRGTRIHGKHSDIGNNEGGISGRYLEHPLYIAFGMA